MQVRARRPEEPAAVFRARSPPAQAAGIVPQSRHYPRRRKLMTAKGTHERIQSKEIVRVFAVSGVRLDDTGQVVEVLWAEVNEKSNLGVSAAVRAPASEVITAIHAGQQVLAVFPKSRGHRPDRSFVVLEQKDGSETLALEGSNALD